MSDVSKFWKSVEMLAANCEIYNTEIARKALISSGRCVIMDRYDGVVKGSNSLHSAFLSWSDPNKPEISIDKTRYSRKRAKKIEQRPIL